MRRALLVLPLLWGSVAPGAVDFQKDVWPILEKRCVDCHRAPYEENGKIKKPKGDLRLDGKGWIRHGVDGEPVIHAGNPRTSLLLTVVSLPPENDDIMPPKGDPLTAPQVDLLRRWIQEGTQFGNWTGDEAGVPAPVVKGADRQPTGPHQLLTALAADVPAAELAALAQPIDVGAVISPAYTNSPLVEVVFAGSESSVDDQALATLENIAPQVSRLDLSRTAITDAGLAALAGMPHLVRLDLRDTEIDGSGLTHLKTCNELRVVNLSLTNITDAELRHLEQLPKLERVYLWGSKVTPAGIKRLQQKRPGLEVIL